MKPSSPRLEAGSEPSLDDALRIDRFRLRRMKKRLSEQQYQQKLQESIGQCERRKAASPRIEYPGDLPISGYRDQIVSLIHDHQAIVVCGETGSGKSTQLPKFCLEAGLGREAMIGHTQPRRLAARSIAARIAEDIDTSVGGLVGYQVRFGDQTSPETLVKLMTDGILLAETQSDRFLDAYDAIIIDEAHERSLNIDFLMGYLRRLQGKRPELKIIITSATIDADRFAEHFCSADGLAPIINVEGRGYPVETRYLPWEDISNDESGRYDLSHHVIEALQSLRHDGDGDTLVFLPTERDIREVSHHVAGHYKRLGLAGRVDLLPLYARLPNKEQQKIFHPGDKRRIVFATNVAESSLTVPGIRYVIDSGTARMSRYSARTKVQRLPIEPISQASANQRSGRCGRVAPGICVRLYSDDDFQSREPFATPEIRRTNLAAVVLQTKTLKLGPLEEFPLLDPPRSEAIREGLRTLVELGAIDDQQELTDIGWKLGRMPVDPRVGRMILAADQHGVLPEVLPIAAALEIPDPRDRPPDKRQAADEAHSQFADPRSDFLGFLRLWRYYEEARGEFSRSKLTRTLRKQFLSPTRMREWSDIYRQLKDVAATSFSPQKGGRQKIGKIRYCDDSEKLVDDDRYASIHQALLAGLLSGVAMAGDHNEYTGAGGLKLFLWPGSGVCASEPRWIVAAELVETSKQYARTVARIQPQWIEKVAAHLLKQSHSDPHWSQKAAGAFCYQRLSLYGMPVVARRRVPLPPIDPVTARTLLIQHGLVDQGLPTTAHFVRHNRQLRSSIESLAAKTRRRDLVIDSYRIAGFYREALPEDVCDRGRLERFARSQQSPAWANQLHTAGGVSSWLQSPPAIDGEATCYMRPEDLIEGVAEEITDKAFPDELAVGGSSLPLEYRFEPGSEHDGISLRIHQSALSQISDDRLGWLVPGLLKTKLIAMIKALPKRIRRNLIPAADVAGAIAEELRPAYGTVPFMPAVCEAMSRRAEMTITARDFQREKMSEFLQFLVNVVDDEGATIASGRDLAPIRKQLGETTPANTETHTDVSDQSWSREKMTSFEIDELPVEVIRQRGGVQIAQYPALVDVDDAVTTRLMPDLQTAEAVTRNGLMRLYAISETKELRNQVRWLPSLEEAKIKLGGAISPADMESSLIDLLARIAFVEGASLVRTKDGFESRRTDRGQRIAEATQEVAKWLSGFTESYFALRRELESIRGDRFADAVADIQDQLSWLMPDRFLSATPWQWLKHYPRYVAAVGYRLDKLRGGAPRDHQNMTTVHELWRRWFVTLDESRRTPIEQASCEFRWMIEELRVSLFAQPLGTSVKVSPQRCEKLLGRSAATR